MQKDLEQLDVIVGVWNSEGEITQKDGAPSKIKGTDTYEWLPGKQYMIHWINVSMGEQEVHAIEIIGGLDETKKAFAMNSFQNDAGHSVMWASKKDERAWLFAGSEMRAILTLPGDDEQSMSATWERREGSEWIHWMDIRFSR